tara:strand:+ start:5096 stop:5284 length:189 start_codon:yes stop_codon:yes gene_type:complete
MTMQLKFKKQDSIGQSLGKKLIKILLACIAIIFAIFLLNKINFPSPKNDIEKDITNEIIKLK